MPVARRTLVRAALLTAAVWAPAGAATPAPAGARLYFISPVDGQRVRGAFTVRFGLKGMGVSHAGVPAPNSGHHHLLVDAAEPLDPEQPIPADGKHLHFGGGQTEATLELPPGRHTLQLVLGDANHMVFNPPVVSQKIRIVVVK